MGFFKPEDFSVDNVFHKGTPAWAENASIIANTKLEREGKVVYGKGLEDHWSQSDHISFSGQVLNNKKALLINIESIEKCTHPKEKVRRHIEYTKENTPGITYRESYECECGAIVKPNGFEEL